MNGGAEQFGDLFVLCSTAGGFSDLYFTTFPYADSAVWTGLPTNMELTFQMWVTNGAPYCVLGTYTSTCTIITAGVDEQAPGDMQVRAVQHGEWLELSAPVALSEVRVYDMVGGLIAARKVNALTASIPIAALVPGTFLLHAVTTDGRVTTQRFIKHH